LLSPGPVKGLFTVKTGKIGKVLRGGCLADFLQPHLKPYSLLRGLRGLRGEENQPLPFQITS